MPMTSVPGYDPYADAPMASIGHTSIPVADSVPQTSMPMTSMGIPDDEESPDAPRRWSEEQVIEWLSGIGAAYAKFGPAFKDYGINGKELLGDNFGLEELEELGVTSKLQQKRILREVAELKQQQG